MGNFGAHGEFPSSSPGVRSKRNCNDATDQTTARSGRQRRASEADVGQVTVLCADDEFVPADDGFVSARGLSARGQVSHLNIFFARGFRGVLKGVRIRIVKFGVIFDRRLLRDGGLGARKRGVFMCFCSLFCRTYFLGIVPFRF